MNKKNSPGMKSTTSTSLINSQKWFSTNCSSTFTYFTSGIKASQQQFKDSGQKHANFVYTQVSTCKCTATFVLPYKCTGKFYQIEQKTQPKDIS